MNYSASIVFTLLALLVCSSVHGRESLSLLSQNATAQGDTDPFSKSETAPGRVKVAEIKGKTPSEGRFYNLTLVPGGSGYPGMNINFDKPADFSKYDVLKVWVKADYPAFYLEIVINGADGVIQDIPLASIASRGYGRMRAGQWSAAYILYKEDPGWVRFGEKMNHTAIKSITVYTFAEYLKKSRPAYNYLVGGMELLTKAEARAEIDSGAGRTVPVTGVKLMQAGDITIWSSDPTEKVYKETPMPSVTGKSLYAEGAGGEYVPVVCNLKPDNKTEITSVVISDLKIKGSSLSSNTAQCRYVDNINGLLEASPDPLPLVQGKRILVPARVNTSIWTTWRIPEGTVPGTYKGKITIILADGRKLTVPVALKVYGFDLPAKTHLKSLYWIHHFYGGVSYFVERSERYWGKQISAFSPDYIECTNNMIANYGEHRVTPELDRNEFQYLTPQDRKQLINRYHFDPGYIIYHNFINEFLAMYPVTPEKIAAVDSSIRKSADEKIAAGFKDITCIKVADEPNEDSLKLTLLAAEEVKKTIPEIQCFYAGSTDKIPEGLVGKMDTYCMQWGIFDYMGEQARERRALGEKFWVYAADYRANSAYDPLEMRQNYWLYWKFNITGVHYAHHMHVCFLTYPNDTYPHSDGLKEIPSVRFEMLRLGQQDYEYIWLLNDLITCTKTTDKAILSLLNVPENLAKNEWESASDPRILIKRRKQIAAAIEKLKD